MPAGRGGGMEVRQPAASSYYYYFMRVTGGQTDREREGE